MINRYPFKFNVDSLEYEDVVDYLKALPSHRYRIAIEETVDGLSIEEWRSIKAHAAQLDAQASGDDHQIVDLEERRALVATDSAKHVEITVKELPAHASRRLLNRVAIQVGLNNAGIERDNWSARFRSGVRSYQVQFADKNDALMFKLAMWKRPGEDAMP